MFKITKESAIKVLENIIKNIKKDEILLLSLNKLKNILIDEFNCLKKINNNVEKEEEEETPTRPEIKRKKIKNKAKKLLNRK
jgi:hypothetical protein